MGYTWKDLTVSGRIPHHKDEPDEIRAHELWKELGAAVKELTEDPKWADLDLMVGQDGV
jgi:hypothetical protein